MFWKGGLRILFLHGLEGSPNGRKAQWLKTNYDAVVPAMDTTAARTFLADAMAGSLLKDKPNEILRDPLKDALGSMDPDLDLVAGSSFGGAVLAELVRLGYWDGPCVFLASAHVKLTTLSSFVGPSICIHGEHDTVIPPGPIQDYVDRCGPPHEFWLTNDDHRLSSILYDGLLKQAIETLAR